MGTEGRRKRASVASRLLEKPFQFDFFQAMRLLERIAQEDSAAFPHWKSVGGDGPPNQELVQLKVLCTRTFPPCEVPSIIRRRPDAEGTPPEGEAPFVMTTTFMGLFGAQGVMPLHYTQTILDRVRRKDYALRDFLDLFHHRILSLFYKAWEKYRFPIAFERTRRHTLKPLKLDTFTESLFSLTGMGTEGTRERLLIDDETFLYYAGHFAHRPRSASGLQQILEDYFSFTVLVQQYAGHWLYIDPADQSRLPNAEGTLGGNNRLGEETVIGHRMWNCETRFRLRIGPVTYRQYQRLMPSGDQLAEVAQLTRSYVGNSLDFDMQLVLKNSEVPQCILGDEESPCFLGYNMWLRVGEFVHDVEDAVFQHPGYPLGTAKAAG
ncbi:type VI secretion system baseplate subunit TssG [Bremerella cremea]|uniref:Type VI secretion system baseplate subunit TssG n=1 Tax=Blastopirellula marina TaxID=124 RepID=A0A2S8FVJ3_9BACT|nr:MULTISPECIES: type VI secretion system baseplate subunit TssG [Pirellulaceae]PQO36198.1 type VI secretion system baseplate subunit TssG [Blastopirellula marina]RCS48875.1 type VI secretion system baseplate subunit TssG [Bremerella cremea]